MAQSNLTGWSSVVIRTMLGRDGATAGAANPQASRRLPWRRSGSQPGRCPYPTFERACAVLSSSCRSSCRTFADILGSELGGCRTVCLSVPSVQGRGHSGRIWTYRSVPKWYHGPVLPLACRGRVDIPPVWGVLGDLWETVLETPTAENPFAGGDPCVDLGPVVAPIGPSSSFECTVKPSQKIFVAAWSSECSTFEEPPFFGSDEAELRACARAADAGLAVTLTVDGRPCR